MQKIMRLDTRGKESTKGHSELRNRTSHAAKKVENEAENEARNIKRSFSWKTTGEIA